MHSSLVSPGALLLAASFAIPQFAAGQVSGSVDQSIVGAWQLVSAEDRTDAGQVIQFWGQRPVGTLIYAASGHMSAQVLLDPHPSFAAGNVWAPGGKELLPTASVDEIRAAYAGYYAYFGTYTLDPKARTVTVTHHVKASLRPHESGLQYLRPYEFKGDELVLHTRSTRARPTKDCARS